MKKIKISALPEGDSLKGLYTIGTDANNKSVKVSLEAVETAAESANSAAAAATSAASAANTAAAAANTAAAAANTAAQNANEALENITYTGLVIPTSMELAEAITVTTLSMIEIRDEVVATPMNADNNAGGIYISPILSPAGAMNNFIFLNEDDSVCTIGTDGLITAVAVGSSKVTVIPTFNTSLAKTVTVTVISSSNTYLNILPTSWDFGTDTDETAEIGINSSSAWTVTGVPSDMSLSATSGSAGISAIILSRTSTSLGGTATITFKNEDGDEATLSVTRTAVSVSEPYITASQTSVNLTDIGTTTTITISSSSAWTVAQSGTGVTVSPTSGTSGDTAVTISHTSEEGETVLTFTNTEGKSVQVTVVVYTANSL